MTVLWEISPENQTYFLLAATTTALTLLISIFNFSQHMLLGRDPTARNISIIVIMMVPFLATESWLGMKFAHDYFHFNILRQAYEAVGVYCFYALLVHNLGGQERINNLYLNRKEETGHKWVLIKPEDEHFKHNRVCFFVPKWKVDDFPNRVRVGIFQFVVVKTLSAAVGFGLQLKGILQEGTLRWNVGYPYLAVVSLVSMIWALYCVLLFYKEFNEDLKELHVLMKFICMKGVVLFIILQRLVASILIQTGVVKYSIPSQTQAPASGLHDFLICVEMLPAAVFMLFAFNYSNVSIRKEWQKMDVDEV